MYTTKCETCQKQTIPYVLNNLGLYVGYEASTEQCNLGLIPILNAALELCMKFSELPHVYS